MAEFWSTERIDPHNYMMKKYGLYPTSFHDISRERWYEMKEFCIATFGPRGGLSGPWDTSYVTMSFCFRRECDRMVFKMAFPNG